MPMLMLAEQQLAMQSHHHLPNNGQPQPKARGASAGIATCKGLRQLLGAIFGQA